MQQSDYGVRRSTPGELQRYSQEAFAGNPTCVSCNAAPAHPNGDVCLGCDPAYGGGERYDHVRYPDEGWN